LPGRARRATYEGFFHSQEVRMGDKGKKAKDKSQKQNVDKKQQADKKKADKQVKKTDGK
jgi:hypothetical protein